MAYKRYMVFSYCYYGCESPFDAVDSDYDDRDAAMAAANALEYDEVSVFDRITGTFIYESENER